MGPKKWLTRDLSIRGPAFTPFSVFAEKIAGQVVGILDGDTIEVLHNNRAERIRLNGIDCLEKGQANGTKAKQAASKLVFGKEVTLQTYGHDKYGRTIADVLLPDGVNVNLELVRNGWCWWYLLGEISNVDAYLRQGIDLNCAKL